MDRYISHTMPKMLLITFTAVLFSVNIFAQTLTEAEYFFDTDPGVGNGTPVSFTAGDTVNFTTQIPISGLSPGFHRVFVRFKNDSNKWSLYEGRTFYIQPTPDPPDTAAQIVAAEYFFDTDPGVGNGTPINLSPADTVNFIPKVPVGNLSDGFHTVFIRFMDADGYWSLYEGRTFYLQPTPNPPDTAAQILAAEYFFNTDPGVGNGTAINLTPADTIDFVPKIPAGSLSDGFHTVFIRFLDADGYWSLYEGRTFYIQPKVAQSPAAKLTSIEYFIDTDPGVGNGTSVSITSADSFDLQVNVATTGIDTGSYHLYMRVMDADGIWSHYQKDLFRVFDCPIPNAIFTVDDVCVGDTTYFIDKSLNVDPAATYAWDIDNDGTIDFTTKGSVQKYFSSSGSYTAKLKITYDNDCKDSTLVNFEVQDPPTVSFTGLSSAYCEKDADVTLSGSPSGGTFSGNGIRGKVYRPSVAGAGTDTIIYTYTSTGGCSGTDVQVTTIRETFSTNKTATICEGDKIWLQGDWQTTAGIYYDTLAAATGCDSIIATTLDIDPATRSTIAETVCNSYTSPSGRYTWNSNGTYTDTIPNAAGCDSIITIDLTINSNTRTMNASSCKSYTSPSGKYTWATSGTYTDTILKTTGCDSVLTIHLTITYNTSTVSADACKTYTSPSGNYVWTATGTYTDTIPDASGCDSIITINLTVNNPDTTVSISSMTITANATGAQYQWLDCDNGYSAIAGETNRSFTATADGNYAVEVTENGCVDTSSCINLKKVGINESAAANELRVYPNPTTGKVYIELEKPESWLQLTIYNSAGKRISQQVFTSTYLLEPQIKGPAGIYLVEVNNAAGNVYRVKVVKE